ncbi:hypothetical protein KIN20_006409 [Parelaphostrongylus tenuis]|uniref:Uncharacterized protein n=1 Tax=Parelaphostrongylus tenuis TaxID=148309 RepID=A0AAD5M3J7_PARTN|nr:hypothetical protein KIN20_006409 [Parelaphostrongylus tenuis]
MRQIDGIFNDVPSLASYPAVATYAVKFSGSKGNIGQARFENMIEKIKIFECPCLFKDAITAEEAKGRLLVSLAFNSREELFLEACYGSRASVLELL